MQPAKRSWTQLSLRDLLLLTSICALGILLYLSRVQQAKERALITELSNKLDRQGPRLPSIGPLRPLHNRLVSTRAGGIVYYHAEEAWPTYFLNKQPLELFGSTYIPDVKLLKQPLQVKAELLGALHESFGQTAGSLNAPTVGPADLGFKLSLKCQANTPPGLYFLRLQLLNADGAEVTSSLATVELK